MSPLKKTKSRLSRLVSILALMSMFVVAVADAEAAELRLKQQCTVGGGVVTLGDVAEIFDVDAKTVEDLSAVQLFPAPAPSGRRFLRLREIQDLLLLQGVDLREHRFSGSSQVSITAVVKTDRVDNSRTRPLSFSSKRRAKRIIREAISEYLKQHVSAEMPWMVEVEPSEADTRLIEAGRRQVTITGGQAPWTGVQRFLVTLTPVGATSATDGKAATEGAIVNVSHEEEIRRFAVDAVVSVPAAVVVATRALHRGAIVNPGDVELQIAPSAVGEKGEPLHSLDEVIGKQTTQAISSGAVLQSKALRAPLLVKRGEVVTVNVLSAGIRVRTNGRARDDGSLGDVISVESLHDRRTFFAQVRAVREVEVFARGVQAETVR